MSTLSPQTATCTVVADGCDTPALTWSQVLPSAPEPSYDQDVLPYQSMPLPEPMCVEPQVSPELRHVALALSKVMVEALRGSRPLAQLHRWFDEPALIEIADRARQAAHRSDLQVGSIRIQLPAPDAAEVCVRIVCGQRHAAAALRLDRDRGRWICRQLAMGPI